MRARIISNEWIYFDNITTHEESVLWDEFSVSIDTTYIDNDQMAWDGVYRKYNRAKKRIARPLLAMLNKICKKHNLPLEVVDEREPWEYKAWNADDVHKDILPGISLDDHQVRAIKKACKSDCGIIDVPTGGGKTEIACGICRVIDCPTVVIAEQKVVIDQFKERLELRKLDEEIGLFYAGEKPNGQKIVVGSIQSLQTPPKIRPKPSKKEDQSDKNYKDSLKRWENSVKAYKTRLKNAKYLQEYVKKAEMVIVDECDLATSKPYKNLFRHYFKGRKRFGFSGTPFDESKPVEALVVQEHLGSVISKETRANLVKIGRIISCDYNMIAIGPFDGIRDSSTYDIARQEHMVENDKFHKLIASIAKKYKGDGTLVLVDREPLGFSLIEAIEEVGLSAAFIYGKTPKKQRSESIKRFENREIDVLIGGKIVNRGLDLKGGCENLIIATGGKLRSEFEQKIGRALRRNKKGHSRVFDFYFRCNKHLYKHSKARLQVMTSLNYETKVIFPGGTIDGKKLINQNFRVSKKFFAK